MTYSLDEILRLGTHEPGHCHLAPCNPPLRHDRRVFERRLAHKELISQHAQTPEIDLLAVKVVTSARLDHLGGQVVQRPTHGLSAVVGRVHTPTEIGDLDLPVDADEDVLWLDVAVHDVLTVQVLERRGHLRDVLRRLPFRESPFFPQMLVQLALAREFEDQKDTLTIVEMPVEPEDVGVPEVGLNLDFTADLFLDFALL